MEHDRSEPIARGRTGTVRGRRTAQQADPRVALVIRIAFFCTLAGLAVLLTSIGLKAIRDQHFENRWTTTTGIGVNSVYASHVEHGVQILEGAAAIQFGIGLVAAAAMLGGWSLGLMLLISRGTRLPEKPRWTIAHTLATVFSLVCALTALANLLPPVHLSQRPFTLGFYGTIVLVTLALLAAVAAQRPKAGAMIFPVIVVAAICLGSLTGGIIFGFFAWLVLAVHVLLLVPRLREQALNADPGD